MVKLGTQLFGTYDKKGLLSKILIYKLKAELEPQSWETLCLRLHLITKAYAPIAHGVINGTGFIPAVTIRPQT